MATDTKPTIGTGHEQFIEVSKRWSGPALLLMRILIGWHFFWAGITKVIEGDWSAEGYLRGVPEANPFKGFFTAMANSDLLPMIDLLNMWGLTLVGIGLIFGIALRWSALWGSVMMWFYWASSLPLANSIFVDDHIVYIALLFALGAFGAGRYYGVDAYIEEWRLVQNNPVLKYLLG